ncbi:MAG: hypothetical protein ACK55I_06785, partial [bacterium]
MGVPQQHTGGVKRPHAHYRDVDKASSYVARCSPFCEQGFIQESCMLELLMDPQAWAAFATLTALELVLGIDNVIFISI